MEWKHKRAGYTFYKSLERCSSAPPPDRPKIDFSASSDAKLVVFSLFITLNLEWLSSNFTFLWQLPPRCVVSPSASINVHWILCALLEISTIYGVHELYNTEEDALLDISDVFLRNPYFLDLILVTFSSESNKKIFDLRIFAKLRNQILIWIYMQFHRAVKWPPYEMFSSLAFSALSF